VNIVYHSYRILFIAVSIKNVVDMSGNKQFVKTRGCMSFITRTAATLQLQQVQVQLCQHIASALWRAYRQLCRRRCFILPPP